VVCLEMVWNSVVLGQHFEDEQYKKVLPPGQTRCSVTSSAADFSRNTKFF